MLSDYIGLNDIIETWAEKTPDKEAAVIEGKRITFGQLKCIAEKIANSENPQRFEQLLRLPIVYIPSG